MEGQNVSGFLVIKTYFYFNSYFLIGYSFPHTNKIKSELKFRLTGLLVLVSTLIYRYIYTYTHSHAHTYINTAPRAWEGTFTP